MHYDITEGLVTCWFKVTRQRIGYSSSFVLRHHRLSYYSHWCVLFPTKFRRAIPKAKLSGHSSNIQQASVNNLKWKACSLDGAACPWSSQFLKSPILIKRPRESIRVIRVMGEIEITRGAPSCRVSGCEQMSKFDNKGRTRKWTWLESSLINYQGASSGDLPVHSFLKTCGFDSGAVR